MPRKNAKSRKAHKQILDGGENSSTDLKEVEEDDDDYQTDTGPTSSALTNGSKTSLQKKRKRVIRSVYTKESRTTKWRKVKAEEEREVENLKGNTLISSFFRITSHNLPERNELQTEIEEIEELTDPIPAADLLEETVDKFPTEEFDPDQTAYVCSSNGLATPCSPLSASPSIRVLSIEPETKRIPSEENDAPAPTCTSSGPAAPALRFLSGQDGTVRISLGDLIQFVYGDDSADGAFIERQTIKTFGIDNREFKHRYRVDITDPKGGFLPGVLQVGIDGSLLELQQKLDEEYESLQEDRRLLHEFNLPGRDNSTTHYRPVNLNRIVQNATQIFHIDRKFDHRYCVDVTDPKGGFLLGVLQVGIDGSSPELQQKLDEEYKSLQEDRRLLRKFNLPGRDNSTAHYLPVNLNRIVQNATQDFHIDRRKPSNLEPVYIIEQVQQLADRLIVRRDDDPLMREAAENASLAFRMHLRATFAARPVLEEFRLSREAFDWVLGEVEKKFNQSVAHSGEMCGARAAQSIGDPATQLIEIINVAANIKAPSPAAPVCSLDEPATILPLSASHPSIVLSSEPETLRFASGEEENDGSSDEEGDVARPANLLTIPPGTLLDDDEDGDQEEMLEVVRRRLSELKKLYATKAVTRSLVHLTAVEKYVKRRKYLERHHRSKTPWQTASLNVARQMGKGPSYARTVRYNTVYLSKHKKLPPDGRGKNRPVSLLDNEAVLHKIKVHLASIEIGEVTPRKLRKFILSEILPTIDQQSLPQGLPFKISLATVYRWLRKLGYTHHQTKKGVYVDGHERPDVVQYREVFLSKMKEYERYMCSYDEQTLEPLPLFLEPGAREHILVVQDESIFHVNDQKREVWLCGNQQVLRQKGHGRSIHVSDFLCEKSDTGRLSLSTEQLALHDKLPAEQQLGITDSRKIIYPGKNADDWWDMKQLLAQLANGVKIFEFLHPDTVGVFLFDCSAAHEAYSEDALNVNNMNVNPGGRQRHLRDTVIPTNNPPPSPGHHDSRGQVQSMTYAANHPDPDLAGKAKGLLAVLKERESVWDRFCKEHGKKRPVGVCASCKLSQKKREALERIAKAEDSGQEALPSEEDLQLAKEMPSEAPNNWCCAKKVLSLQQDFLDEKPMLQTYLEGQGHVCLFLPKFHCELNAIELYWGFGKYKYRDTNDGKFPTARTLVPHCLDLCSTATIRRFFRKCWRYMDSYRKGLNFCEAAYAVKKYKSHRRVPQAAELREALEKFQN